MLLLDRSTASPPRAPQPYVCEAVAYTGAGSAIMVDRRPASTPRTALLWMRTRAEHAAEQLHPKLAAPVRRWIADDAEQDKARQNLRNGQPYSYVVSVMGLVLAARPTAPILQQLSRAQERGAS